MLRESLVGLMDTMSVTSSIKTETSLLCEHPSILISTLNLRRAMSSSSQEIG